MEVWRKNIYIASFATFIAGIGMSQVAPLLPLFIAELGITDTLENAKWSGIIFGCNFISLAIFAPIWGRLSDMFGAKKMMMRASLWMALIIMAMSYADNVYQLIVLRLMQGAMSGFLGAVSPFIATEAPEKHSGYAMGLFFTSQMAGLLIGPLFGGYLAETFGMRDAFLIIGVFCLLGFFTVLFIKEKQRAPRTKKSPYFFTIWRGLEAKKKVFLIFLISFSLQLSLFSSQPLITLYIAKIDPEITHLATVAGAVFAVSGFASMLSAMYMGRLSDRLGAGKVLLVSLFLAGLSFLPQAFSTSALELGFYRFLLGVASSGLFPSLNILLRKNIPEETIGSVFGVHQSVQFVGIFVGAFFGGRVAKTLGMESIFLLSGVLLLVMVLPLFLLERGNKGEK